MPGRLSAAAVAAAAVLLWSAPAGAAGGGTDYPIGPKDLLDVRVIEEPSLNVERRVNAEGEIDLPVVGRLVVADLTATEAAAAIRTALEGFLQKATVTVEVLEARSRPITVLGAVKKPGILELSGRWTLLEALTEAGGLTSDHGSTIHVLRRSDNGLSDQLAIPVEDLLVRADRTVNIPILANDVINVAETLEVTVFLMGEVGRQGAVTFSSRERVTLLAALAKAGGLTDRASKKILVKRPRGGGAATELVVNYKSLLSGREPDFPLKDGDLIVVKESFF